LGLAPIIVLTGFPDLNNTIHGIEVTEYSADLIGFSSTFNFPTHNPSSLDISSNIGDTFRHGPHHGAQKSIRTRL
jgi:hypothetical protein